jgi:fibronectin type 3 domain-containing protein
LRYTGWTPWDQLGTLESEQILVAGSGSQTGQSRWGDYSSVSIDPTDDCTFWVTGQYMAATGKLAWSSAIGTFKFPTCGIPPTAPSPPSLAGTAGNNFANLTWAAPVNGGAQISGYNIYRGGASGLETLLTSVAAGVTSYRDTTVTDFNQYYYEVTATNSAGESAMANELALTPTTTTPAAPSLTSTGTNHGVSLSWNAPDDGGSQITGYNVFRGSSAGGETLLTTVSAPSTGYTDPTNLGSSPVYYKVMAVNAVGESSLSNEVALMPTSTAVTTSVSSSTYGQTVAVTATVTALPPGSGTPSGSVNFMDNGTLLRTANLSKGKVIYASTTLKPGLHQITAVYNGSPTFLTSQAGLGQTVTQASTTTTVSSSVNPSTVGQVVTITAAVTAVPPGGGVPTGSVVFQDDSTTLATVTLSGGSAHYNATFRTAGAHQVTVTYKGSANYLVSSWSLSQTVN